MSIVMSIPMTSNAPADMSTATNTDIPTSTPTTGVAPEAADMTTASNTDIPTSTPTAMDTTMPQAPPVRSM